MSPEEILKAKEKRAEYQNNLMDRLGNPLLVLRVNYPGVVKDTPVTRGIFREIEVQITHALKAETVFRGVTVTAEGPLMTLSVNKSAEVLKQFAMGIEDSHPLGRFADVDVYVSDGPLSRTQFGKDPRTCYLCGEPAHNCVRSRNHSCDELIDHIDRQYLKFLESRSYEDAQNF